MANSKSKYLNFISTPIGNRPVTDLPGIGDTYGGRLRSNGFKTANDVLQQFLKMSKDKTKFSDWLTKIITTRGPNYRNCVDDCYNGLTQYCFNHLQSPISARKIVNQRRGVQEPKTQQPLRSHYQKGKVKLTTNKDSVAVNIESPRRVDENRWVIFSASQSKKKIFSDHHSTELSNNLVSQPPIRQKSTKTENFIDNSQEFTKPQSPQESRHKNVSQEIRGIHTLSYDLVVPCNSRLCKTCFHIWPCSTFPFPYKNLEYPIINGNDYLLTCKSWNVIYVIFCRQHPQYQYVGQTTQELHNRVNGHRSDYKNPKKNHTVLYKHFSLTNHSFSDVRIIPVEKVSEKDRLNEREQWWIDELHSLYTVNKNGLNMKNALKT